MIAGQKSDDQCKSRLLALIALSVACVLCVLVVQDIFIYLLISSRAGMSCSLSGVCVFKAPKLSVEGYTVVPCEFSFRSFHSCHTLVDLMVKLNKNL